MSAIKLPELPTVRIGDKELSQVWFRAHEVRAYAKQAVREALAAQVPVAWMVCRNGVGIDRPSRDRTLVESYFKASSPNSHVVALALIPEKDHG